MVRFSYVLSVICWFFSLSNVSAQGFQVIFPGMSGSDLIDSVAAHYRPAVVLDYAHSRDTLYKLLASDDDSLRCIYSGHTLYLDPTQDPTQYVYQNGGPNGMNAEHAYPQAKGASPNTNAHSDMHHLYPARIPVNEARGDKPYAEIPDQQTQKWFLNDQTLTTIPTQHIELYAESGSAAFEPREAVKGDLARSIFYFYTVYRSQANAADPNFFNLQRATLCQWDAQDPADSAELRKTWRIAAYQDGKPNPFVVDCSLAYRSWCPEVPPSCIAATHDITALPSLQMRISPQPVTSDARVYMNLPFRGNLRGRVLSILGQELSVFEMNDVSAGEFVLPIDVLALTKNGAWMGFLEVNLAGPEGRARQILPLVVAW